MCRTTRGTHGLFFNTFSQIHRFEQDDLQTWNPRIQRHFLSIETRIAKVTMSIPRFSRKCETFVFDHWTILSQILWWKRRGRKFPKSGDFPCWRLNFKTEVSVSAHSSQCRGHMKWGSMLKISDLKSTTDFPEGDKLIGGLTIFKQLGWWCCSRPIKSGDDLCAQAKREKIGCYWQINVFEGSYEVARYCETSNGVGIEQPWIESKWTDCVWWKNIVKVRAIFKWNEK